MCGAAATKNHHIPSVRFNTSTVSNQQRVRTKARAGAEAADKDAHVRAFTNCDWMAAIGARSEGRAGAAAKAATLLWLCCTGHHNTDQRDPMNRVQCGCFARCAIPTAAGQDSREMFAKKIFT